MNFLGWQLRTVRRSPTSPKSRGLPPSYPRASSCTLARSSALSRSPAAGRRATAAWQGGKNVLDRNKEGEEAAFWIFSCLSERRSDPTYVRNTRSTADRR